MAMTPTILTVGPIAERLLLPVTDGAEIFGERRYEEGVSFHVRFRKLRDCRFLGLSWYVGQTQLPFDFGPPRPMMAPTATFPTGPQEAGPWRIWGVATVEGLTAIAVHRCHRLWTTTTRFY